MMKYQNNNNNKIYIYITFFYFVFYYIYLITYYQKSMGSVCRNCPNEISQNFSLENTPEFS
jgi:hypothetical protein